MFTSTIRYPKGDRFIRIHQSLLVACRGNSCAAALIVFLEQWHTVKSAGTDYTALYNQMMDDLNEPKKIDTGQWQYHTYTQLQTALLQYNQDTILNAINLLEELDFISTDVPEHLEILFKTGRANWYLLRADKINEWFDRLEFELSPKKLQFPRQPTNVKPKKESEVATGKMQSDAMQVFNYRNQRRVEAWAARGVKARYSRITDDQITMITQHFKRGYSIAQLCYAVEGLVNNPFYMGDNERKTPYDDLKHIFKDDAQVRKHISFAESKGISFAEVQRRLSGAPDSPTAAQFQTYHQRLAWIIAPHVLSAGDLPEAEAELRKHYDAHIPFDIDVVYQALVAKVNEKAGIFTSLHKERWKLYKEILEKLHVK